MKTEFTAQEKTTILKRLILENGPEPEICDEYTISSDQLNSNILNP